jgi:hypothetical protein
MFHFAEKYDRTQFRSFLALGQGKSLTITPANRSAFMSFCRELDNTEFLNIFNTHNHFTLENVFAHLDFCHVANTDPSEAIRFVAMNFTDCAPSDLEHVTLEHFVAIVGHANLAIENEDWLYALIAAKVRADASYAPLLESVHYENISLESLNDFFSLVGSDFGFLSPGVWKALSVRFTAAPAPSGGHMNKPVTLTFSEEQPFAGIIAELTRKAGGNVHDHHEVVITAKSAGRTYPPKVAADLESKDCYWSELKHENWLCYDFWNRRVSLTGYSIAGPPWSPFLVSWIIEGSEDGRTWTELDQKNDVSGMAKDAAVGSFKIAKQAVVRMVRIRQSLPATTSAAEYFGLSKFELFGTLHEPSESK